MINATIYNDPACPWAYSENPALRVIEWRYGDSDRLEARARRSQRDDGSIPREPKVA